MVRAGRACTGRDVYYKLTVIGNVIVAEAVCKWLIIISRRKHDAFGRFLTIAIITRSPDGILTDGRLPVPRRRRPSVVIYCNNDIIAGLKPWGTVGGFRGIFIVQGAGIFSVISTTNIFIVYLVT